MLCSVSGVSVITVVRNGEAYLAQAIDSILGQTVRPCQVLVVDGRSTDRTLEIARSYQEIQYVVQQTTGLANARNLGVRHATGEFIAFLDHDDVWMPRKLELQLRRMCDNPTLGYTTTQMVFVTEGNTESEPRSAPTPSSLMVRREIFEPVGEFDPQYAIGCDADWFTRARDLAVPTEELPEVLLRKRRHNSNLSRNASLNRLEMVRVARQSILRRSRITG